MIILLCFISPRRGKSTRKHGIFAVDKLDNIVSTAREAVAAAEFPARRHQEGHSRLVMSWNTLSHFYFECFNCNAAAAFGAKCRRRNRPCRVATARCSRREYNAQNSELTEPGAAVAPVFISITPPAPKRHSKNNPVQIISVRFRVRNRRR